MSGYKIFWSILSVGVLVLLPPVHSSVLRCDLMDPHSSESEICWKQLLYKIYTQVPQTAVADEAVPVHVRNAELSSALMQLYGFNKFNGKRNPDFSRDAMGYIPSDVSPYKENN